MNGKTHIGYNVYDLDESIAFYRDVLGAKLEFRNPRRRSASLTVGGNEVNLFETPAFGGYHRSILKALHIGFQVAGRGDVDRIHERAKEHGATVFAPPYERFDGDYTLFLQDPDGMQLEVFFGTHELERTEAAQ